jgi:hypothetical protein
MQNSQLNNRSQDDMVDSLSDRIAFTYLNEDTSILEAKSSGIKRIEANKNSEVSSKQTK